MNAVHFGAGNIGRGFIGQILVDSGYEVCFVDVNEKLVDLLQSRREYTVSLADEGHAMKVVRNVTALNAKDTQAVAKAIARTDLVTTAVGVSVLQHIAPAIAEGLQLRVQEETLQPLHVIACENAIEASRQLKEHVYAIINDETKSRVDQWVAFPNAAVDRIVPIQQHEDPLHVTVEPFFEWIIDRSQMIGEFKPLRGVIYVDDLQPYIERKLFTVNTGHCSAAYLGYLAGYDTIQRTMEDPAIRDQVRDVLEETGALLVEKYHFEADSHRQYIFKTLRRFSNPHLTDEVVRVGRSPIRKLSPNDRLIKPTVEAFARGIPINGLAKAIAAALRFDYREDPEAVQLQNTIRAKGISDALTLYTGVGAGHPVHQLVLENARDLQQVK